MSRAVVIHRTGGPEVLSFESVPLREPGPGEVLLEQTAIGVNFIDTYHRSGLYAVPALPTGLGVEAAGVVLRVGPDVTSVRSGERVAYASGPPGAYAEQRLVPAERLVPLPDDIDDELAAASLLKGMTVEALTQRVYPVKSGDAVLLHAAAGGVGLIACQWLASLGARVIATVGSDDKAALVRERGAAEVIVYTREDFVARVREITNDEGVRVVYDSVGKATLAKSLECLAQRGMLVSFGNASGKPEPVDPLTLGSKGSLFLTRPVLFHYVATRQELLLSAQAVFEALRSGRVKVHIGQRFPLEQARAAHQALESRATSGSTLLIHRA